jgi:DNA-binding NtrC family response regulator
MQFNLKKRRITMEMQVQNIFIVDDNQLMVTDLKLHLQERFGASVKISTFENGESCLKKIDKDTHIVILDYFMEGKNGLDILKSIKEINPKTDVVMLTSNEDIVLAINAFRAGAKDYVIKGASAWKKIAKIIIHIITEPIRILVREFRISKFMAVFLLTFVTMGIIVLFAMYVIN